MKSCRVLIGPIISRRCEICSGTGLLFGSGDCTSTPPFNCVGRVGCCKKNSDFDASVLRKSSDSGRFRTRCPVGGSSLLVRLCMRLVGGGGPSVGFDFSGCFTAKSVVRKADGVRRVSSERNPVARRCW